MVTGAEVSAAIGAAKAAAETLGLIFKAIDAVKKAKFARQQLPKELEALAAEVQVLQCRVQRAGPPSTPAGQVALENLQNTTLDIQKELQPLLDDIITQDTAPAAAGKKPSAFKIFLISCWSGVKKTSTAVTEAAVTPTHALQLTGVKDRLKKAYELAKENGAFTASLQLVTGLPALYIQHPDLWLEVADKIKKQAKLQEESQQLRGVLVRGGKGMGKTTLARAVATGFAKDPKLGQLFPDGVFEVSFAATEPLSSGSSSSSVARAVATQQGILLKMLQGVSLLDSKDILPQHLEAVKTELGKQLSGNKCLLLLDGVWDQHIVPHFNFVGFEGVLLVTGLTSDAWLSAPEVVVVNQARVVERKLPSDSSLAQRLLMSRALNDPDAYAPPQGCEEFVKALLDKCGSSILALVVVGSTVRRLSSSYSGPDLWSIAVRGLEDALQRRTAEENDLTPYGAIEFAVSHLEENARKQLFLCFELFRHGVQVPVKLVTLAAQHCCPTDPRFDDVVRLLLSDALDLELLSTQPGPYSWSSQYVLLDLVASYLYRLSDADAQRLADCDLPSSRLFSSSGSGGTVDDKLLLAAFLAYMGSERAVTKAEAYMRQSETGQGVLASMAPVKHLLLANAAMTADFARSIDGSDPMYDQIKHIQDCCIALRDSAGGCSSTAAAAGSS